MNLLELNDSDIKSLEQLQKEVITPNVDAIVEAFYEFLLAHNDTAHFLNEEGLISKLKKTQKSYLLSLGTGFNSYEYFEERLRVGLAHAWVGIPLSVYLCAYRKLVHLINQTMCKAVRQSPSEREALSNIIQKITMLDISLAIETYHLSQVTHLEDSLKSLQREEDKLRQIANTDSLTRLANRDNVLFQLGQALQNVQNDHSSLCVLMADLDHFKKINDTYGHLVGDGVLREVAARFKSAVRDVDIVGRYGGEEFVIILRNSSLTSSSEIAERIRRHIEESPIHLQNTAINITVSLGLCIARAGDNVDSLLDRTDHALYQAKNNGRNRVVVYNDDVDRN